MHARVISGRLHRNCSRSVEHHWSTTALELFSAPALPLECDQFKPHLGKCLRGLFQVDCTETALAQWNITEALLHWSYSVQLLCHWNVTRSSPITQAPTINLKRSNRSRCETALKPLTGIRAAPINGTTNLWRWTRPFLANFCETLQQCDQQTQSQHLKWTTARLLWHWKNAFSFLSVSIVYCGLCWLLFD